MKGQGPRPLHCMLEQFCLLVDDDRCSTLTSAYGTPLTEDITIDDMKWFQTPSVIYSEPGNLNLFCRTST